MSEAPAEQTDRNFTLLEGNSSIAAVIDKILRSPPRENPFHVLDLDDIVRKHLNWLQQLPRVKPFYAVKCNDDSAILETLALLGTGFDCASKGEIGKILSLGVNQQRIIYAHPIKSKESLGYAKNKGITTMTFDNELELVKIAEFYPESNLVLRIRHDSDKALVPLGKKFGCDARLEGPQLLDKAKKLNLTVVGISFHVGCGSLDADSFYNAIRAAKVLFQYASSIGYSFSLLDIGGGFPGDAEKPIDEFAKAINRALDEFFPNLADIKVIAEPGRYYVGSAVRLLTVIQGKKIISDPNDSSKMRHVMYYLNDGVFGTLFDWVSLRAINDLERLVPMIIHSKRDEIRFKSTIWGPTCDATDIICENVDFPEHQIGEYVLFENLGAYGMTFATNFNGFPKPGIEVYVRQDTWKALAALKDVNWQDKTIHLLQQCL
ncbi:ornithine decarboxylase-like [Topomyia yanbarensis]|uniref:ornithine decarboxylase-like n=1 Tax=Topomyia yanbarensis TaxID=2498891 RepID=UPI00273B6193|nr:ornithine decarboxylase-like [Topomyia yanbarensis]